MPSKLKKEIESLAEIVRCHPDGISTEELLQFMDFVAPKRTVQYRLSALVKSGILRVEGAGRSTRYHFNQVIENKLILRPSESTETTFMIPLSLDGKEVRKQISVPIQLRQHVSYHIEFLDSYEPNKTSYLSQSIIEKLFKLGVGAEKGRPAGTYARKIYQRLLIDLSWNSSRLEGNTYSLLETERLLATGEEASGKNQMDAQMILNHKAAIEFIVEMAEEVDINRYTILNIHGLLSHDLLMDPRACGRLRTIPVKIGKSVYYPIEVPQLIEQYFQLIIQKATAIQNPFEQSFFLMVHLSYLQPFQDVNKRVSRLAGNIPFIRENLSPLSFVDVPESDYIQGLLAIYELNRIELFRDVFVWAYERSASLYLATLEAIGKPDPFRTLYRNFIQQAVCTVVQNKMDKLTSAQFISSFAKENISSKDVNRFIEIVEIEVSSLHEGNFARFKIRPSEFFEWQRLWK
ncbi:MAG: Fic family protein [Verrucomicrobia bacterium]|nr:Fic family protein [Verrucomicrobiota bacterium]MBS0647076.1 Fic family protein [Verrucomicrobiota bacterium]